MNWLIYAKLIAVTFFWGGTFVAGRVVAQSMPIELAGALRFVIAAVLLIALSHYAAPEEKRHKIPLSQHLILFAMGITGIFAYNQFFLGALSHISAGRTALFVPLAPVCVVLLAALLFKERLTLQNYCGVALAFFGTLVVVSRGHPQSLLTDAFGYGEFLMCMAIVSWVIYTLLWKKVRISSLAATTYSTVWGAVLFSLITVLTVDFDAVHIRAADWLSLIYLGAFGTVLAFVWYADGIRKIGAARTVIFNNLVPLYAVVLGYLLLDEPIHWSMPAGGTVSFVGVLLANKRGGSSLKAAE